MGLALDPGRQSVFVTGLEDEMQVIDTGTRTIVDTIEDVGWPGPMAADPASGLVLLCNEAAGTVTIVDADTHEVLKTLEVGAPGPFGVAVDSQARRAYVDDKVIDLETLEVAGWLRPRGRAGSWTQWLSTPTTAPRTHGCEAASGAMSSSPSRPHPLTPTTGRSPAPTPVGDLGHHGTGAASSHSSDNASRAVLNTSPSAIPRVVRQRTSGR